MGLDVATTPSRTSAPGFPAWTHRGRCRLRQDRVAHHRIAHLLAERNVHPGQILAITFTNKARAR
ncbi:hypothetical protein STENM327S_04414 [Streptomyces tendae]